MTTDIKWATQNLQYSAMQTIQLYDCKVFDEDDSSSSYTDNDDDLQRSLK